MSDFPKGILVTGAAGFVGSALVLRLIAAGKNCVHVAVNENRFDFPLAVTVHRNMNLAAKTDWRPCLSGIDCVVHAAARVHVMHDTVADPLSEFRKVNVEGTLGLAQQAASMGVRRFVYLSSIKVNGEFTEPGKAFVEGDQPAPIDPYGISKFEAEQGLMLIGRDSGMEIVIVRPPLVYGPGVKGNFLTILRWLSRGVPLPLGGILNRRSMVFVENLVDFISVCIEHPRAANQIFLVCDGDDLSTTDLLKRLAVAMGKTACLVPLPARVLMGVGFILGKEEVFRRLYGSLQIDMAKAQQLLGWFPPRKVDDGLAATARHFLGRTP